MQSLLFLSFALLSVISATPAGPVSPQFSRLIFHASVTPVPGFYPISLIVPKFNNSLDANHARAKALVYVVPGSLEELENKCLNFFRTQYNEDFVANGYKNLTTGSWYSANAIMAPISRSAPAGAPGLMYDEEFKHRSGVWHASEAGFNLEWQADGVYGGVLAGATFKKGYLAQCAYQYQYDPESNLANPKNIDRLWVRSTNPTIVIANARGLPQMDGQHSVTFDDQSEGQINEYMRYDKNATHYLINSRIIYLKYTDPSLLL